MTFLKKYGVWGALFLAIGIAVPRSARAVVPPDFIFNIGSQIAQAFSVVVVFLSAVFITSYQFIKNKFLTLRSRRLFWVFSILFIFVVSFGGAAWYATHTQKSLYVKWLEWFQHSGQQTIAEQGHYFYDRIIISGKDKHNQPLLISFEAARQELKNHLFGHSYNALVLYRGKVFSDYVVLNSSSSSIRESGFVTTFLHITTPQLPTEQYAFSFKFGNRDFVIDLSDLDGDFLVKNRLDYLRYVSAGHARVRVDDEIVEARVMVDQVLSDNQKIPTLEGYNPKYVSHSLALWDGEGAFYHLDKSDSFSSDVPYPSHTWVLYKDSHGNTKKVYEAALDFKQDNKKYEWHISIPQLDNTVMDFKLISRLSGDKSSFVGVVSGTLSVGGVEKTVTGYALFEDTR